MRGGILALGMIAAIAVAAVVIIFLVRVPNMYSTAGLGEVTYTPDAAEITSSIYAESEASLDAAKQAAATMRQILAALKDAGVTADDIRTADVRSGMQESDAERKPDDKRLYYAEQAVVVQVHDIGRIGKVLDAIARAGSNYWHVDYRASNRQLAEARARKAALLNAIATADAYAQDGKFKRGRILKIQDEAVEFPEVDYARRDYRSGRSGRPIFRPENVVVTGSRLKDMDTTFDIPPPKEVTVSATTQVLFEIE